MNTILFNRVELWGYRHNEYLKQNQPTMINVMRMNGTLESYLKQVDDDAEDMLFQTVKQMAKAEGVNEALKASDQLEWVQRMNNICNRWKKSS